jgi:hypothetical protein
MSHYDSIISRNTRKIYSEYQRTIGADCYYISRRFSDHILNFISKNGLPCPSDLFLLHHETPEGWHAPISIDPAPGEHADEEYFSWI